MAACKPHFLETLFRRHARELRTLAERRVGGQEADDVVQEAFLRLAEVGPEHPVGNPGGYLYRVSMNVATDHLRRQARQASRMVPIEEGLAVPDPAPSVEATVFSKQQVALLKAAVQELPPRCREVFVLHKFQHFSYSEIATKLDLSESTVVKHMVKALAHCKRRVLGACRT